MELYIFLAGTASANYPTTNGSVLNGLRDVVVTKLGTSGTIEFAAVIGGSSTELPTSMVLGCNDELYVLAKVNPALGTPARYYGFRPKYW